MKDQELDQLLNQWEAPETPPWLKTKVMASVRAESMAQEQGVFSLWWSKLGFKVTTFAAAAILVAILMVSVLTQPKQSASEMVSLEDALESFASFSDDEVNSWGDDPF